MMPGSIPMIVLSSLPIMVALSVPALLLAGLLGRARPTRPTCRACRRDLDGTALLPAACPGCAASLTAPRAVRFGGYRLRPRPLLLGLGVGAVIAFPMLLARLHAGPTTAIFNGVAIEANVTAERYEQATAAGDSTAWTWIDAHLRAGALDDGLRKRAGKDFVEAVRMGGVLDGVMIQALPRLVDVIDEAELAEAILEPCEPARLSVRSHTPNEVLLEVNWLGAGWTALNREPSLCVVMAITEVRVDGKVVRPRHPDGRFRCASGVTSLHLPMEPLEEDGSLPRIEIDTTTAVLRDPPNWLRHGNLPGPPESWPGVAAMRWDTVATRSP